MVVLVVKSLPADAGDIRDAGSIPRSGPSRAGHGSPLQYSQLENPMDRGAWWASRTRLKRLSTQRVYIRLRAAAPVKFSFLG